MAVARLSRITIRAPRPELGVALARIISFGDFHPSKREGMVQDIGILTIASRAQAVKSKASELLGEEPFKTGGGSTSIERFEARSIDDLVNQLEEYVDVIEKNLSVFTAEEDRRGVTGVLVAVSEAGGMIFDDLQRILVLPPRDGSVRFEGFVPNKSLELLRSSVGPYVESIEPVSTKSKEIPYVPTLLVNPGVVSAFEDLTLQRGLPKYGQVDPTPILAFAFPFFFGVMFGDVGHGLLLLALGYYLLERTTYRSWGKQILILSSSTIVFGLLRGVFFGVSFASPLHDLIRLPSFFSAAFTLSYIPVLLEVAIVIGTFHLASGYAIAFVNEERAGDLTDAFLIRLPTVFLYVFMVLLALAVVGTALNLSVLFTDQAATPVIGDLLGVDVPIAWTARISVLVVLTSLLLSVVGHPVKERESGGDLKAAIRALGAGLVDTLIKPFEFFVNTLSYVRLGVLLITTTLLGSLAAGLISDGPGGIIAAALLTLMVVGLEGVIVYVQDMRLQLYEWFSEFYSGNGIPFVPLVSEGTHFRIVWLT